MPWAQHGKVSRFRALGQLWSSLCVLGPLSELLHTPHNLYPQSVPDMKTEKAPARQVRFVADALPGGRLDSH